MFADVIHGIRQTLDYGYDAFGFARSETYAPGVVRETIYDELGFLSELRLPAVAGSVATIRFGRAYDGRTIRTETPR